MYCEDHAGDTHPAHPVSLQLLLCRLRDAVAVAAPGLFRYHLVVGAAEHRGALPLSAPANPARPRHHSPPLARPPGARVARGQLCLAVWRLISPPLAARTTTNDHIPFGHDLQSALSQS